MTRDDWEPVAGTALITGASGGIGLELARLFARDGWSLVLVARRADRLDALAGELRGRFGAPVEVIPADLSVPGAPGEIARALRVRSVAVDVLVNDAGVGVYGPFAATDLEAELGMIQVNVTALTHLTKLLLPGMIRRGRGRLLNVASTAAFQPGPLMAAYYATKAYVLSLSEALSEELEGSGVTVTALCPGPALTGFQAAAGMERSKLFRRIGVLDAVTVAHAGYAGLMKGKRVVVPGLVNKILAQSVRFAPRRLLTAIVRRMQESESVRG